MLHRTLCAFALTLAACGGPFEVDLPDQEPRLVVESLFAADSLISLELGRSGSVLDPEAPYSDPVETATVRIYEDGVLAGTARYVPNRLRYRSDVRAVAGRTYRVEIEAPGFDPVQAEDTVPLAQPFRASVVRGPEPEGERDREDEITVRFDDPAGDDFYALYGLVERTFGGGQMPQVFPLSFRSSDPLLVDGNLTGLIADFDTPFYQRAYFQSLPFDGGSPAIRLGLMRIQDPAGVSTQITTRLRLARLSRTYYEYVTALESDTGGTPFSTPSELPSNVRGGYGIFAAFAASEEVIPE